MYAVFIIGSRFGFMFAGSFSQCSLFIRDSGRHDLEILEDE